MTNGDTLGRLFTNACRRYGDRIAVTDGTGAVRTYADLIDRGARLANALHGLGLQAGDHVAAMLEDRAEAVEVYIGTALAGCPLVHVSARLQAPEVAFQLADSCSKALIYTAGVAPVVDAVPGLHDLGPVIRIGGPRVAGSYEYLLDGASETIPPDRRGAADVAIIGYTSGTSGRPKGAMISHRSVVLCTRLSPYHFRIPAASRLAYSASLSFVATVWSQVFPHLYVGGQVRLLGDYDPESWSAVMLRDRSTFTYLPTPLIREFTTEVLRQPQLLKSLRVVLHAGSVAPRPQVESLVSVIGSRYLDVWGMTEVTGALTATTAEDYQTGCPADDILSSAGHPVPSANLWVADEDGAALGPGETGELVAEVDTLFSGYWDDPEKTAAAMKGRAYFTGDVGHIDEAGYVYVTGRKTDMIVSGGMNVYAAEVERTLLGLDGVNQVAVVGLPHERWGETVAAAVVREPAALLDENGVIAYAKANLASYKKPTQVHFLESLPLNVGHKVDKFALRQQLLRAEHAAATPGQ